MSFSRIRYLISAVIAICFYSACMPVTASAQESKLTSIQQQLATLEVSSGGRLGISAINTANNARIQYRADERFPMNCTSKVIGVSAILKKSESDHSLLQQKLNFTKKDVDLAGWAPITKQHITKGMTISELCGAAIMQSDNAAMNILVKNLGGIDALNQFLHAIGDTTSRFDRGWPAEASSIPGDLRDTSTPSAMEHSFQQLVLGDILTLPQREQLQTWLKNNTTGNARIRAGVPKGWIVGDKTGTGDYGTSNDIAIIWPPHAAPIIVAIYFTQNQKDAALRENVLASATRMLIDEFAKSDNLEGAV